MLPPRIPFRATASRPRASVTSTKHPAFFLRGKPQLLPLLIRSHDLYPPSPSSFVAVQGPPHWLDRSIDLYDLILVHSTLTRSKKKASFWLGGIDPRRSVQSLLFFFHPFSSSQNGLDLDRTSNPSPGTSPTTPSIPGSTTTTLPARLDFLERRMMLFAAESAGVAVVDATDIHGDARRGPT